MPTSKKYIETKTPTKDPKPFTPIVIILYDYTNEKAIVQHTAWYIEHNPGKHPTPYGPKYVILKKGRKYFSVKDDFDNAFYEKHGYQVRGWVTPYGSFKNN